MLAAPAAATTATAQTPPNLLLVVVDDQRWDDLGTAGHPFVRTPHIDRLAREGARFLNAFAVTPLCSPSRANLLTGMYTHHHGIVDNTDRSASSHALATFAPRLQAAGYQTGFIGKWHMGNDPTRRPGFDYWVSMKGQGEALDPELHEDGRTARVPGYVTDIFTERALAFVGQRRDRPFFLMLAHKALHPNIVQRDDGTTSPIGEGGFIPAERHRTLYAGDRIPRRPNYGMPPRDKPALERRIGQLPPLGPATVTDDATIRDRLRMLAAVDEGLGRILEALEARRALDHTVVVLVSDNGYFYGEHGLSEERRLAYGRSLVAVLDGTAAPWRTSFLIQYASDTVFPRIERMGYDAVRTERHKYVRYRELTGMDELFDLDADPHELHNLAGSPQARELRAELDRELVRLLGSRPSGSCHRSPAWDAPRARPRPGGTSPQRFARS